MIKPTLALIPSGVKANKVYSVLPSDGVGDFDFERDTIATRVNKDGLIETVDAYVPRLNYPLIDGVVSGCPSLLLEPERTNLIQYSEDFISTYYNTGSTIISSNAIASPEGVLNADKVTEDASNSYHYKRRLFSVSGEFTMSIFVKKAERDKIWLGNVSTVQYSIFDLTNESSTNSGTTSSKIENYGNGWYRCTVVDTLNQSAFLSFGLVNDNNNISYQGDGTSGLYAWGFQYEANSSYATSYIPTNGGTATRSAETCNNAGDVNTFNDSEGVLMAEISALDNDGTSRLISLSYSGNHNRLNFYYRSIENQILVKSEINNGTPTDIVFDVFDVKLLSKFAIKYNSSELKVFHNGFEVGSLNGNFSYPSNTLNILNFDNPFTNGSNNFYGNTKQLQYFDTALTDIDLEELTSWTSFNEMATAQQYSII